MAGCPKAELAPVLCPHCEALVCLGHRHQEQHSCPRLEEKVRPMAGTREVVQGILASGPGERQGKKPRSVKAQKTAAKVQLMKLKMSAKVGDPGVPQGERLYLLVALPRDLARPSVGAWVSSTWVVGRVVDSLAAGLGLENRNNVSGAERLRLFRGSDGKSLCGDMGEVVGRLVEREDIFNGDSVLMEYVEEGVEDVEVVGRS